MAAIIRICTYMTLPTFAIVPARALWTGGVSPVCVAFGGGVNDDSGEPA